MATVPNSASARPESPQVSWVLIVVSAAAVAGIGMGLRQVMGLFQRPITEELGIGREAFSFAIALANLVWGFAAPVTGGIADKLGAARVVIFGALSTAAGLLVMYLAKSELHLILAGILLGFGVAGAGVNALVGAVARAAPPERRTIAISWIGMGSGIGVFLALPYTHLLIEQITWKPTLAVLAATAGLMLPLSYWVRGRPQVTATPGVKPQSLKDALVEAARHPSFLLLNAGFFVCGFQVVFYAVHLPAYVADKGLDPSIAIIALTCVGVGNLVGTWLAGQSAAYVPRRYTLSFIYFGRSIVFLAFLFLPVNGTMIIVASCLLGLLWLSTVPLTSSLVGVFFGSAWMTMLYGVVFLSHQIGSFAGVWLAGLLYDATKSYDAMWWICVALGLFAAAVHWPIREVPVARLNAVPAE